MSKRNRAVVLALSVSAALSLPAVPTLADVDLDGDGMSDVWQVRFGALLVDEYFAELALWFGVSPADLPLVLPNIGRFYTPDSATPPLGFMGPT